MRRTFCKSKIHRATITGAELNYEGSLTLDRALMDAADMHGEGVPALFRDFERVQGAKRVKVRRGAIDTGEVILAH